MNTEIDNYTMDEAVDAIDRLIQKDKNGYVVTPNIDHIVKLETDTLLQQVYANADIILTDGKPMIWMSRWYGTPIKEKVSGSDLFPRLCELAAAKEYRVFLLGAAEGVAAKAAANLQKRFPGLMIAGTYWVDFMNRSVDKGKAVETIQKIMKISKEETMAFGDNCNDIAMLLQSGESYAVANAHPQLKEIAKHIAPSYAEDGVLQVIKEKVLG